MHKQLCIFVIHSKKFSHSLLLIDKAFKKLTCQMTENFLTQIANCTVNWLKFLNCHCVLFLSSCCNECCSMTSRIIGKPNLIDCFFSTKYHVKLQVMNQSMRSIIESSFMNACILSHWDKYVHWLFELCN